MSRLDGKDAPRHRAVRAVLRKACCALTGAALGLGLAATPASPSAPAVTPEERAAAVVRPAVVYIEITWTGWVRDQRDGQLWLTRSTDLTFTCSGFLVNPDGYIVTAGHCVDPGVEGAGMAFFEDIADEYVAAGNVSNRATFVQEIMQNSVIEGRVAGVPPERRIYVQRGVVRSGLTDGEAVPARFVGFSKNSEGDVAVIKIDRSKLPAVELAPRGDPPIGTSILAVGYPSSAATVSDTTLEPTNKDGKISTRRTVGGLPFYEISASTSKGMSGGPVVDMEGRVVGLVSFAPAAETQSFNFIAASTLIAEQLTRYGVKNELGPIDQLYRTGLNQFWAGNYKGAMGSFDGVLAQVPSHQQAAEFRARALDARQQDGGGGTGALPVALAVAILVAAGVVAARLVSRRRAGGGGVESPAPPMSVPAPGPQAVAAPAAWSQIATPRDGQRAGPAPAPPVAPAAGPESEANVVTTPVPDVRFCWSCGAEVHAGASFCSACRASLR